MDAAKRTRRLTWLGLGAMGLQFGLLARLTWWEYSWDIMEPVTYFVGYGTSMAMYAYYVVTRQVSFANYSLISTNSSYFADQTNKLNEVDRL